MTIHSPVHDFAATDLTVEMLLNLVEAKSAAMDASRKLNHSGYKGRNLPPRNRPYTDTHNRATKHRFREALMLYLESIDLDRTGFCLDASGP